MHQYLFHIGDFPIRMYGLMLTLAIFLATGTAYFLARQDGRWHEHVLDIGIYGGFAGLIGGRLWDVFFFDWSYYQDHLLEIPFVWQGGMAVQGGMLGGLVTGIIGTSLGALNSMGGTLGGLLGGNGASAANKEISALRDENILLKSGKYTDDKTLGMTVQLARQEEQIKALRTEVGQAIQMPHRDGGGKCVLRLMPALVYLLDDTQAIA